MRIADTGRTWMAPVLLVALLGSAACGGSKAVDARPGEADPATTTTTTTVAADQAGASGQKPPEAPATTTTTTTPATNTTTAAQAKTETGSALVKPGPKGQQTVKATLAMACVTAGGSQSITIRTQPGSGVGFDTIYSDGKSGLVEGHYGGNAGGMADEDGTWSHTWVVAATAPPGKAQVNVIAGSLDYGNAQATLYFTVAQGTGRCG